MFASTKTKKITVRDDEAERDVVVTVRKLSWRQLREAGERQTADAIKAASATGPEMIRALRDTAPRADAKAADGQPDPAERYRRYQREAVLDFGVAGWTLERAVKDGLGDLDEETAERLHREIVDLSLPPADAEAARGEGSGTSTGS